MRPVHVSFYSQRYQCTTRSLRLQGSVTSVRLENEFWEILDHLAEDQHLSTPQFISQLYTEVIESKRETANFTSILRVTCVMHLHT